jgi:hypothetical protein
MRLIYADREGASRTGLPLVHPEGLAVPLRLLSKLFADQRCGCHVQPWGGQHSNISLKFRSYRCCVC